MKNIPIIFVIALLACSPGEEMDSQDSVTTISEPPAWVKEAIWYQIFPERFRNGDPSNDPTPEDILGCYPGFVPDGWEITPWTQDWYAPDTYWDQLEGEKERYYGGEIQSFGQKAQLRRYGGDLQGVFDQIDYLDSLGVNAIYFNPLNDAPSLHKYDARYYHHIDRNFGPTPRRDVELMETERGDDPSTWKMTGADSMFVALIEALHKRDIRLIMDYSWNHTGHTFWAWRDIVENGQNSAYADWYWIESFDDPDTEEDEFSYKGWFGVKDLPELRETQYHDPTQGIKAFEGNLANSKAIQHIFDVTRRWLDPNGDGDPSDGVDGFRLDVAAEVPLGFWRSYRNFVREINPEAYLVGEVWWEKWPDKLLDPKPFLEGDVFDAVMNYRWYRATRAFFNDSPDISAKALVDSLQSYTSNISEANNYAMMNLGASHDAPRMLTSLYNKNAYKFNSVPDAEGNYRINKPDETTYNTLKLLLIQQFTYVGAPHIWNGDEMGMWGADDPDPRKPLIWPDYEFEPETLHPFDVERPTDQVKFDTALFSFYQKLIQMRRNHSDLVSGDIEYLYHENDILAYSRYGEDSEIIVAFNASKETQAVDLPVKVEGSYQGVLNGVDYSTSDGQINLSLVGRSAVVIKSQ
jgi:glycosidase